MNQPGEQPEHGEPGFSSAHLAEELEQSQERQRPGTEFRFAFCEHYQPDNATLAAAWLRDCDVIAIEAVGGSPEVRADTERDMNLFARLAARGHDVNQIQYLIKDQPPFRRQLLTKLASYGLKRIVLIDAGDADTEIMDALRNYYDAQSGYLGATLRSMPLRELQTATGKYLQASAYMEAPREALQAGQLEQLAQPETGEPPRKVGVVVGLKHTQTKDRLDQLDYITSQRQIDVLSPGFLAQDIPRSFEARATTFLSTHPGEPLPTAMVNRVVLERCYIRSQVIEDDLIYPDRHVSDEDLFEQHSYRATKLVEAMDDASVASLLEKLDHLYRTEHKNDSSVIDDALQENYNLYRDRLPRIRGGYT